MNHEPPSGCGPGYRRMPDAKVPKCDGANARAGGNQVTSLACHDDGMVRNGPSGKVDSMRWIVGAVAFAIVLPIVLVANGRLRRPWWL